MTPSPWEQVAGADRLAAFLADAELDYGVVDLRIVLEGDPDPRTLLLIEKSARDAGLELVRVEPRAEWIVRRAR